MKSTIVTETPVGGSLERLVGHLHSGGQITSGAQWIYRIKEGEYFLCCSTEGCCDSWMNTKEMLKYINIESGSWRECTKPAEGEKV